MVSVIVKPPQCVTWLQGGAQDEAGFLNTVLSGMMDE